MKLNYHALEKLRVPKPVKRVPWLIEKVKAKIILDLGAFDETSLSKINYDKWLHKKLANSAKEVIGVDNSSKMSKEGLLTGNNSKINFGDVYDLKPFTNNKTFDIVLAGELIEHLSDTLSFFRNIKSNNKLVGKEFIITTPNAVSLHNISLGLFSRESTHKDHLQIYSFKTLNTLCKRSGFKSWEIIPYHVTFTEMLIGSKGPKKLFVGIFEKTINLLEYFFPILSAGWIVKIKI